MNRVKGTFYYFPVGQGLFYGGIIQNDDGSSFSFVYDCGSEDKWKSTLTKSINDFQFLLLKNNVHHLDLIVLSHLHADHFSGIYELIKVVGTPKKMIIPFIDGDDLERETILYSLFLNKEDFFKKQEIIAFFANQYKTSQRIPTGDFIFNLNNDLDDRRDAGSYYLDDVVVEIPLWNKFQETWKFLFVCGSTGKKNPIIIKKIKNDIYSLISKSGCSSVQDYIGKEGELGFNKLQNIYIMNGFSSGSSLNNTSTLLLHYPITRTPFFVKFYSNVTSCYTQHENIVSLLTGDSKITKSQANVLVKHLDVVEPCFLVAQLPHHGASSNFVSFSKYLWTYLTNGICVVSFGTKNKYSHPSANALHSFSLNQLIKVNEFKGMNYIIVI